MSRGKAHPYYGKLNTKDLTNEVKSLWRSRDDELEPLPSWGWSFDLEVDMEQCDQRELLQKIFAVSNLTQVEINIIEWWVVDNYTLEDISEFVDLTKERVRQIYKKSMRKIRANQKKITGEVVYELDCQVTTYSNWRKHRGCR